MPDEKETSARSATVGLCEDGSFADCMLNSDLAVATWQSVQAPAQVRWTGGILEPLVVATTASTSWACTTSPRRRARIAPAQMLIIGAAHRLLHLRLGKAGYAPDARSPLARAGREGDRPGNVTIVEPRIHRARWPSISGGGVCTPEDFKPAGDFDALFLPSASPTS
jgi:hypothetical protein